MALPDTITQGGLVGVVATFGLRLLFQEIRARRKDIQTDRTERDAMKNLKDENERLKSVRDELEKKIDASDAEFEQERKARRGVEYELDREKRRTAELEDRIVKMESERGNH